LGAPILRPGCRSCRERELIELIFLIVFQFRLGRGVFHPDSWPESPVLGRDDHMDYLGGPSTSPAALRAHALIAKYYHRNNACTVGGKPWVKPTDCDMLPDHAIAELIQAVLAFPADTVIGRAMPTLQTEGCLFTVQRREKAHHS
jgi:hypothetical protein